MISFLKKKIGRALDTLIGENPIDVKNIPIFINNYNRVSSLKSLISGLEKRGYFNIHIIDNNSTYPPLLEYYKNCNYKIHRLNKNLGFKAFWKSGLWYKYMRRYYCYTDSDLSLIEDCPEDFMSKFYLILEKYPNVHKVGFSLKIDDLPDQFLQKDQVLNWESRFYQNEKEENLFIAPIDTTFALYRPFSKRGKRDGTDEMIRVGAPYQCRHLPWYVNSFNPSNEEKFYAQSLKQPTHWVEHNKKVY